jgi:hypothetical protein
MSEMTYGSMSDSDLEASLTGETLDLDADDTATTPAGEEPAAGDEDQGATDDQQEGDTKPEGWKEDGPGDIKRALHEARERERIAVAQAQEVAQRLAAIEAQQQQAKVQADQAALEAEHARLYEEEGPEAAAEFAQRVNAHRAQQAQQEAEQQRSAERFELSATYAAKTFPDYGERVSLLYGKLGAETVDALAAKHGGTDPAGWAYAFAKANFPTPGDLDAMLDARDAQRKADLTAKHRPNATAGHQTVGHISSDTQATPAPKPVRRMTDKELERSLRS